MFMKSVVKQINRDNFYKINLVACKKETKLQCHKTFILLIVEYSSSVWDPVCNNQFTEELKSVQGKAAR